MVRANQLNLTTEEPNITGRKLGAGNEYPYIVRIYSVMNAYFYAYLSTNVNHMRMWNRIRTYLRIHSLRYINEYGLVHDCRLLYVFTIMDLHACDLFTNID